MARGAYLVGPRRIGHRLAHDEEGGHGTSVEDPGGETEEVDEGADVRRDHHDESDRSLRREQKYVLGAEVEFVGQNFQGKAGQWTEGNKEVGKQPISGGILEKGNGTGNREQGVNGEIIQIVIII